LDLYGFETQTFEISQLPRPRSFSVYAGEVPCSHLDYTMSSALTRHCHNTKRPSSTHRHL